MKRTKKAGVTYLNETLLDFMISVGAVCCLLGVLYSQFLLCDIYSVAVHVIGFLVLVCLKANKQKLTIQSAGCIVFLYFCFFYTPFEWIFAGGIRSNVTYVIFMFSCLMIIILDGQLKNSMLLLYLFLIVILVSSDVITASAFQRNAIEVYEKAIVFTIALAAMAFILNAIKRQIDISKDMLEEAALTDELTKAYNGRLMKEKLAALEKTYLTNGANYGAAILDIDDFKKINDTFGHLYGDEVIRQLAVNIKRVMDENTLLCRYGGDEFIILFTGHKKQDIYSVCEEVRRSVQNESISDKNIHVTISMGVCERKELTADEDILKKIDELLYESKKSGKNKVSFKVS